MPNVRSLLCLAAAAVSVSSVASAATIVQYQFTGTESTGTYSFVDSDRAPTMTAANATATSITNFSPNTIMSGANYGWTTSRYMTIQYSSSYSIDLNKGYFDFTVSAANGYELDLDGISLMAGRGGNSGPRSFNIHSSVQGLLLTNASVSGGDVTLGTANDGLTYRNATSNPAPTMPTYSYTLDGSYQNLSSVTFRVYFATPGVSQAVDFDNITVSGTVSAVPEPAAIGSIGLAGLSLLRRQRKA